MTTSKFIIHFRLTLRAIAKICFILALIYLAISVLWSGYRMQFDNDEFSHAHLTYWLNQRLTPYQDYYASVYTPLYHWFLTPLFWAREFQVETLVDARILMVGLYLLRLSLLFLLSKLLFDSTSAIITLSLVLLDPLSTFSDMQIRPDNLMLVLFLGGLLLLQLSLTKFQLSLAGASGALIGLSVLTLGKIVPSLLALTMGLVISLGRKNRRVLLCFLGGGVVTGLLFLIFLLGKDVTREFWQQAIVNVPDFYASHINPLPLGFFYRPYNNLVYGFSGKPLNWIYVWLLPLIAATGWYHTLINQIKQRKSQALNPLLIGLVIALPVQYLSLFIVNSVFIQYYIPIIYLLTFFAGRAIGALLNTMHNEWLNIIAIIVFIIFASQSAKGNFLRAKYYGNVEQVKRLSILEDKIPVSAKVFPAGLFRPLTYPLWYGLFWGDLPASLKAQLPDMLPIISRPDVNYVLTNGYEIQFYPSQIQDYIRHNFEDQSTGDNLWTRIKQ